MSLTEDKRQVKLENVHELTNYYNDSSIQQEWKQLHSANKYELQEMQAFDADEASASDLEICLENKPENHSHLQLSKDLIWRAC